MLLSRTPNICNKLSVELTATTVLKRYFRPKTYPEIDDRFRGEKPLRIGYEAHHHAKGLLPRLNIREKRLPTMPITIKEDPWSPAQATKGQNDFIRILGDERIQQHDLLTHIPDWLRGYKDTHKEYSVLMRRRKECEHWKYSKPLKWLHLEQRIKFLYRRINNKYKPPEVELLNKSKYIE